MKWLPREFAGVRTPDEVLGDLATIAAAPAPFPQAEASVRSPNATDGVSYSGALSVMRQADLITLRVGDEQVAVFAAAAIRGGWLRTLDGADYHELVIDVGGALIGLADEYNRWSRWGERASSTPARPSRSSASSPMRTLRSR